jgi:O-antigen/teichoic acid export membrane protein
MSVIKKQTILGTVYAYVGVLVGTIAQALIIPNFFSPEENGLLAMLMNWTLILVFITNLGFNSAGIRYFDAFRDGSKKHNGYLFNGLIFFLIGTILCIFILIFFKEQIISSSVADNALFEKYYYYIFPITVATALFNIFDNYAKGLYDTVMGNFLSQFLQRFLVLVVIILYVLSVFERSTFVLFWAIALSVPTVWMVIHAYRLGNFSLKPSSFLIKSTVFPEFLKFAGFSILTGLSSIIITKLDTLMVYEYLGLGQTGIYNTCMFFGSVMTISYNVTMKASTAIVLDAMGEKDYPKIQQIFVKSSITQLIFGVGLLCIVWANIDVLFSFIKPEYAAGKYVILIIGLAKLYDLASGVNSLILAYSAYYRRDSLLVVTFVGLLFVLNHFMIPLWGLNGAAIAALVATIYYNSARNYLIWRYFRIHPYQWNLVYILLIGAVLAILGNYLPTFDASAIQRFFTLCYKTALLSSLYVFIIYKARFSPDLNGMVSRILKR